MQAITEDVGKIHLIGEQQIALAGRHGVGVGQARRHFGRIAGMGMQQAEVIMHRLGEVALAVVR